MYEGGYRYLGGYETPGFTVPGTGTGTGTGIESMHDDGGMFTYLYICTHTKQTI